MLFVVDNVPEAVPGRPPRPVDVWCPTLGQTTVLATSRQRTLLAGPQAVDAIELDTLDPDAAVRLLTADVPVHADPDVWAQVARWVGHLPLTLEVLNGALRAHAVTPTQMAAMAARDGMVGEVDALVEVLRPHVPAGAVRGIAAALNTSYVTLTSAARDAAQVLAQLGPEPIPTVLVDALDIAPKVRVELVARSFIAGSTSTDDVELFGRMHRVMADFIGRQATDAAADRRRAVTAVQTVVDYEVLEDPRVWRLLTACVPHAEHLIARITDDPTSGVDLRRRVGRLLWSQGLSRRAVGFNRDAVDVAQRVLGDEHPATLASMNDLAITLDALGDAAGARDLHERALAGRRRVLGDDHPLTHQSINNLTHKPADDKRPQGA